MASAEPPLRPGPEWLAGQVSDRPGEVTRAGQIIAAGGRSNDACLHARQFFEGVLLPSPETVLTVGDYRYAAGRLHGAGRAVHAETLEALGATDNEWQAARPSWEARYRDRSATAAERDAASLISAGLVAERGKPGHGTDGAWYARGIDHRTGQPAVIVTTSAMTRDIVSFPTVPVANAWLRSRAPETAGPLVRTADTRGIREEEILAWLLRHPGGTGQVAEQTGQAAWTTHLRAELFATLSWLTVGGGTPDYSVIAEAYTRRLLRAPRWAAADIGWPGADRAMTYLQRLAATPVTDRQARSAVDAVAGADATAKATSPGLRAPYPRPRSQPSLLAPPGHRPATGPGTGATPRL